MKRSWKVILPRATKSCWRISMIVSLNLYLNLGKLRHPISVICGNQSGTEMTEVFLEDWLILNNSTSTERSRVQGKRVKRQARGSTMLKRQASGSTMLKRQASGSTILTEKYESGVRLTYSCGVARQFSNFTGLYDER